MAGPDRHAASIARARSRAWRRSPALVAACSATTAPRPRRARPHRAPRHRAPRAPRATRRAARAPPSARPRSARTSRTPVAEGAPSRRSSTTAQAQTGIDGHGQHHDHGTFQDQISSYLQGTPDDVVNWFAGYRMRFFAARAC